MRSDRRTDMINVIVAFRNFAKAPKNENFQTPKMEAMFKLNEELIVLQKKTNHDHVIFKYAN
jgi:hypothetical protein